MQLRYLYLPEQKEFVIYSIHSDFIIMHSIQVWSSFSREATRYLSIIIQDEHNLLTNEVIIDHLKNIC